MSGSQPQPQYQPQPNMAVTEKQPNLVLVISILDSFVHCNKSRCHWVAATRKNH